MFRKFRLFQQAETADLETAQKYGATFTPSTENQRLWFRRGLKTVGNIPSSAFNFVKGSIDLMNPISTFGKVKQAISEFRGLADEAGGYVQWRMGVLTRNCSRQPMKDSSQRLLGAN